MKRLMFLPNSLLYILSRDYFDLIEGVGMGYHFMRQDLFEWLYWDLKTLNMNTFWGIIR